MSKLEEAARIAQQAIEQDRRSGSYIYFILDGDRGAVKIGRSRNPQKRFKAFQTAHSTQLEIVGLIDGGSIIEWLIHSNFRSHRISGEWFAYNDFVRETIEVYNGQHRYLNAEEAREMREVYRARNLFQKDKG